MIKDIIGLTGYSVDDLGNVYKDGVKISIHIANGFRRASLIASRGNSKEVYVAKLVYTAFNSLPFNTKLYLEHLDGNIQNDTLTNLKPTTTAAIRKRAFDRDRAKLNIPADAVEIPNYPGYRITRNGVVYGAAGIKTERISTDGYPCVQLHRDGMGSRCIRIHRILAKLFIPNPNGYDVVDHIDGNRMNYALSNLRWCNQKDNMHNPVTVARQAAVYRSAEFKAKRTAISKKLWQTPEYRLKHRQHWKNQYSFNIITTQPPEDKEIMIPFTITPKITCKCTNCVHRRFCEPDGLNQEKVVCRSFELDVIALIPFLKNEIVDSWKALDKMFDQCRKDNPEDGVFKKD